ncbi:rCG59300 [Rattus norvegicus]|uniref:RCG59300 n=1 Tax=Rattus norvegicus TaxID=10116 RepID=A6K7U0_RAT|nr:rCG59300 [Rattus norvegicus]
MASFLLSVQHTFLFPTIPPHAPVCCSQVHEFVHQSSSVSRGLVEFTSHTTLTHYTENFHFEEKDRKRFAFHRVSAPNSFDWLMRYELNEKNYS